MPASTSRAQCNHCAFKAHKVNSAISCLQYSHIVSAPGGQTDPQFEPTSFTPTELMQNLAAHQYESKQVLSDSCVPGGPPPDAAAVGERPTSSAARCPSTPRPRATPPNLTLVVEAPPQGQNSRNLTISHARTVVRECCKGDDESQWEMGKFDPPPPKNPLTDGYQNLYR